MPAAPFTPSPYIDAKPLTADEEAEYAAMSPQEVLSEIERLTALAEVKAGEPSPEPHQCQDQIARIALSWIAAHSLTKSGEVIAQAALVSQRASHPRWFE